MKKSASVVYTKDKFEQCLEAALFLGFIGIPCAESVMDTDVLSKRGSMSISLLDYFDNNSSTRDFDEECIKWLLSQLNVLSHDLDATLKIFELYNKSNIRLGEYSCGKYFPMQEKAYDYYFDYRTVLNELCENMDESYSGFYCYSVAVCIWRMHQIATYLKMEKIYDVESVDRLFKKNGNDTNDSYYLVMARLYSMEDGFEEKAIKYYEKYISLIQSRVADAYYAEILYEVGHYLEVKGDSKSAIKYYFRAGEANSQNYRAIYKIAKDNENKNNYYEARRLYKIERSILENYEQEKCLQCREIEYIIKTDYFQWNIYKKFGTEDDINNTFRKLHRDVQLPEYGTVFFDRFYKDEKETYIEHLQKRVSRFVY